MNNSNTNNIQIPITAEQFNQQMQQLQQQRMAISAQMQQQMNSSNNTHQNNHNNTITHQNNPNNFNTHQNIPNNANLYQNNPNHHQNNTHTQVQFQQLRDMCPTPMISVPMSMINPMSMYSIAPHQQYGATAVGTSPPGTAATTVVQEVQPPSLPVQGQPTVAAPTETITGQGQDPSGDNNKKRAATSSEDDAAAVDDTGGTGIGGIGDKERDMSQEQEPATKKSKSDSTNKSDSTAEERDPKVVTPTKKQEVPSYEEILGMQCSQMRTMLVELGMDGGEDVRKRAKLEAEMKKMKQPELFLLLFSKLHSVGNAIFFKKNSTPGLEVCADKLREGKNNLII